MKYRRVPPAKLEQIATELRTKFGKLDGKRLLIEDLVEKLGFELFPVDGIKEELGVDAYIPKRPNTLIVDRAQMNGGSPRYFFTLAEEVAHSRIHLAGYPPTPEGRQQLVDWIASLSKQEYRELEWDAKHLAGALLMPPVEFCGLFRDYVAEAKEKLGSAGDEKTVLRFALRRLYMTYCVSFEAAAVRARTLKLISQKQLATLKSQQQSPDFSSTYYT